MSHVKHISVEELAADLTAILDTVRAEHTSVVVELGGGESVVIKRHAPSRRRTRSARSQDTGTQTRTRRPQAEPVIDPQNISSVGAVYDLDPGSITPG